MDPFVDQLKRLCTAHPMRSKWIFVPTHAVGRTMGDRLAREGTNWLNLRFVTPLDIALRMGAPYLVESGIDPSEEGLGPALIMRLLLDLPREGGYFRPLADHPTMAEALWSTIRELRMAGVRAESLTAVTFSSPAKQRELTALLSNYERFLVQTKRADSAAVYEEAMKHPAWCPIQPEDCWTELPDFQWSHLQRLLIDAVPGERLNPCAFGLRDVVVPRRLISLKAERVTADTVANPLAFLMSPSSINGRRGLNAKIGLFHAGGRDAETEEVFRRILAAGASLDQVEIACASDAHMTLIWEKALRHNWPVTLGSGIPAAFTRPGRALVGFCDWIETDFSAGHFRRLLQAGDLSLQQSDKGFTAGQAARILARAGAGWGRDTYGRALGRLQKTYENRAEDNEASEEDRTDAQAKAEQTAKVCAWITGLVASVPAPTSDDKVPLQGVVKGVLEFLDSSTGRASALDYRAHDALREHISELTALGAFSCRLPEALRFIRERVQTLRVASERPRPGSLHVCPIPQCGNSGRQHLFVLGLEEGRVFPQTMEDPVLLDHERARISGDLQLATDRVDEAVYAVLTRLAVSTASVTFSYSCRDTREFRETYASWLMLQAYRLQQGNASLSYRDMKTALGEPKSAVPSDREAAIGPEGWWLRSVVGSGEGGVDALASAFPGVAQGRSAEGHRKSGDFSEFDGYVPEAGAVLDPCAPDKVLSVTELESAAGCPFRFFLRRALGIRPVEDGERDKDVWLDPLTRGSELHDLYAALLRRSRDENRRPTVGDGDWLIARAQERLRELNIEMPAATPEIFDRESNDFIADLRLFVEEESSNSNATPIGLEVSFGRPLEDDDEPLARPEPVELDLGGGIKFRFAGRIDRIDQIGKASFDVLDYKTGGYWRDSWQGTFNGGRRLQHALYGLAAVELLKLQFRNPKVEAGVYYFPTHKGRQERVRIPAPTPNAIAAVLRDLRDVIITGQFIRTLDESDCRFCDYALACGGEVNRQANDKFSDAKLATYRRLTEHA